MWNDDTYSEYEMLEDSTDEFEDTSEYDYQPHEVYDFDDIESDDVDQILEESSFDLEEEDVASVYNARTRLEQARLYEMLINHNIFDGVEANPKAIENVQNELKAYIISRLELLMGIRAPEPKVQQIQEVNVELPFNDIEIDFIKKLAYKGTNGASAGGEPFKPEVSTVNRIAPIKAANTNKPNTLRGLGKKKPQPKPKLTPKPKPTKKAPAKKVVEDKPLRSTPRAKPTKAKPTKAKARTNNRKVSQVEMIKNKRSMTKSEVEEIAKEELRRENELKKQRKGKDWSKMSATEKAAEIRRVNERTAKPKPSTAAQPMTQDQINAIYEQRVMNARPRQGTMGEFNQMLAQKIMSNK